MPLAARRGRSSLSDELVDLIVGCVNSTQDLRACCLAAAVFRQPCQKRLLRSLTLLTRNSSGLPLSATGSHRSIFEAYTRFTTQPRLALYVKELFIVLHHKAIRATPPEYTRAVLDFLTRVHRVRLVNALQTGPEWDLLSPESRSAVMHWVQALADRAIFLQSFELECFVRIPKSLVHDVLYIADSVTFFGSSVDERGPAVPRRSRERQLRIDTEGTGSYVYRSLYQKEFLPYLQLLTNMTLCFEERAGFYAARQLLYVCRMNVKHIEVVCTREPQKSYPDQAKVTELNMPINPGLPVASHLTLTIELPRAGSPPPFPKDNNLTWFTSVLVARVLETCTKAKIVVIPVDVYPDCFRLTGHTFSFIPVTLVPLGTLDAKFAVHGMLERVLWRVSIRPGSVPTLPGMDQLEVFTAALERAMPKIMEKGLLKVEAD
ncbi:hypothetical protein HMN09_00241900 [Mycena chlorophos]|uniref:Uncharacterized protein n=1 Tax=Mycena chlorophos TaxID=658473 RepID=A0A8H6TLU9_MYCCL|nr:hypothetical protein HMN09_00241900 [Mycena chlorophos]